MFRELTITSIFWLLLGAALIIFGVYNWRTYTFSAGLIFLGLGSVFCGITNGFTDYSPTGRLLWRAGIPALIIGLLLTGYSLLKFI